jgi:hypothetical protein
VLCWDHRQHPLRAELSSAKVKGFWIRQRQAASCSLDLSWPPLSPHFATIQFDQSAQFAQSDQPQIIPIKKKFNFFATTYSHNQRAANQLTHKT